MAGLAHVGIGCALKWAAPKTAVEGLIIAAAVSALWIRLDRRTILDLGVTLLGIGAYVLFKLREKRMRVAADGP